MATFDEQFLLCNTAGFAPSDFFLGMGPEALYEPSYNFQSHDYVEYQATEIVFAIAQLPGIEQVRDGEFEKVWRWVRDENLVEITINDENTGPDDGIWLASPLLLACTFSALIEVWTMLIKTRPAIYLHGLDSRMYTRRSFLEEHAVGPLSRASRTIDSAIQERVKREFKHYSSLCGERRRWKEYWKDRTPHMVGSLFDLLPPVVPFRCNDFWQCNDWLSRIAEFDMVAHSRYLPYFSYPKIKQVGHRNQSGFIVWVTQDQEALGKEIAKSLEILADDL